MSDLVSKEEVLRIAEKNLRTNTEYTKNLVLEWLSICLDKAVVADAVEVIRCKDCSSYSPKTRTCSSSYLSGQTIVSGYCFNGTRKKV